MKTFMCPLRLALAAALALSPFAAARAQQAYETPDAAGQALVDALGTDKADKAKLRAVLGDDWEGFVPTGGVDREDVDAFLAHYRERHSFDQPTPDTAVLSVGNEAWTLPVPLVKGADGWRFNPAAGAEQIRIRRIGRNELAAIESMLAYHDAQTEYAENDHDGDGLLEYAQYLVSTDGQHDGLFWAEDDTGEISPLGPLFGDASPQGDWHGYRFRILAGQGPSAPGGAYSYFLGDNMSRGFALVAWPATYDDTGVMSFMVSHDGAVFEKDLGPDTAAKVQDVLIFDPDDSWTEVGTDPAAPPPVAAE